MTRMQFGVEDKSERQGIAVRCDNQAKIELHRIEDINRLPVPSIRHVILRIVLKY